MFSFPENDGATNKGICLSEEDNNEVADVSRVMDNCNSYACIEEVTRQQCLKLLPHPERIQAKNAIEAYRFLKQNIPCQM